LSGRELLIASLLVGQSRLGLLKRPGIGEALLGVAAIGWLAVILFASREVFPVGAFICHQRPERSFFLNGQQMAVCARCMGLYTGAAVGATLAIGAAAAVAASSARLVLLIAALPTAATWTLEFAGLVHLSNNARFAAGLPLGFAAAWLVFSAVRGDRTEATPL
jgi:uncharacterized membrane protein